MTGARSGDILIGTSKATQGAVIKVYYQDIGPEREKVGYIRAYPDLWEKFLNKLGSIPFFSGMNNLQREDWINTNEDDFHLENLIGTYGQMIEVLQPGALNDKMSEASVARLMEGNPDREDRLWDFADIYSMIYTKSGESMTKDDVINAKGAKHHTLVLLRSFWKIGTDYSTVSEYTGTVINIRKGNIMNSATADENNEIILIDSVIAKFEKGNGNKYTQGTGKTSKQEVGFLVEKKRCSMTDVAMNVIIKSLFDTVTDDTIQKIRDSTKYFTPAAYKSLLQKIIRFRPNMVMVYEENYPDLTISVEYPADLFAVVIFTMLAQMPGSFVPDIQRFVSGLESAAKRLAVSIFEDSSIEDTSRLVSLLSGALLSQRVKTWRPSSRLIRKWCETVILGYSSKIGYVYKDTKTFKKGGEPKILSIKNTSLQNCAALLVNLSSFTSDENMVLAISENVRYTNSLNANFPKYMLIGHCVDHHWAPGFVYFYMPETVYLLSTPVVPGKPFSRLMGVIWDKSSGINPRINTNINFEEYYSEPFVEETKDAQRIYMYNLQAKKVMRNPTGDIYRIKFRLDIGWLAAMIGGIHVKVGKNNVTVTLRADNPTIFTAIRTPSRDKKPPLTAEEQDIGIEKAKVLLKQGVKMNQAKAPIPLLEGCKAVLLSRGGEDKFVIRNSKNEVFEWENILQQTINYPIYDEIDNNFIDALTYIGDGVEVECDKSLKIFISKTNDEVLRRVLVYINTFAPRFEMNRINRDGGGTYQAVTLNDVPAFQFILMLSILYPGALRPVEHRPQVFQVVSPPLLWHVRDKILRSISSDISKEDILGWSSVRLEDSRDRTLWEHQESILEDMIKDHENGKKGSFIWLDVGLGKTVIILEYLHYLKTKNELPRYIVYSLPKSAISSVADEMIAYGLNINLILPIKEYKKQGGVLTKGKKGMTVTDSCVPLPYVVNMIEHDKLRVCEKDLLEYTPDMIFIMDEVHKALNDTLRTSAALEIAKLSKEFIVLTGTPVIDRHTYKLTQWLSMIVPFEVNEKNFWVAANSMIARQASTGIKTEHTEIIAPFTSEEQKKYNELVPVPMGGSNKYASREDLAEATKISFQAMDREMIRQVKDLLAEKRGVFLVAENKNHQEKLYRLLLNNTTLSEKNVLLMETGKSINLTKENIQKGLYPNYKVVIVPQRYAEGYTLTALSAMVWGAYPSNQATRTQLEGRINRIGQTVDPLLYRKVHAGTLTYMLRHHNETKSLESALKSMAEEIDAKY